MELGLFSQAAHCFSTARRALIAVANEPAELASAAGALDPQVVAASIASIEAHQAAVLSRTGRSEAAETLFVGAADQLERCVQRLGETQESSLLVVQVMRARVLRLQAKHHEARGRVDEAAASREQATGLEAKYGFASA